MSEAAPDVKTKTKAKKRYLKGKKERRKQRKAIANANKPKPPRNGGIILNSEKEDQKDSDEEQDGEMEEDDDVEIHKSPRSPQLRQTRLQGQKNAPDSDVEMEGENAADGLESDNDEEGTKRTKEKERRPKKKRRKEQKQEIIEDVDETNATDEATVQTVPIPPVNDSVLDDPMDTENAADITDAADKLQPTNALPEDEDLYLPSFPTPFQPPKPSKSELARQGLDKAIIDAEIVDPSITESLEVHEDAGIDQESTRTSRIARRLSTRMLKRLQEIGITDLFAVQTALIPFLVPETITSRHLYQTYDPPRDVCVSAPTGSGKTLAYVVPIVEILSHRVVTRLRALIILPTRDLVQQVRETFEACCKGTKLKIASATGQHSFAHEQSQIVETTNEVLVGGSSRVDILICTPGRLMDHLHITPNFTLQHLRFLVVDEADRLLAQSFQEWLKRVLEAIRPPTTDHFQTHKMSSKESEDPTIYNVFGRSDEAGGMELDSSVEALNHATYPVADAVAPAWVNPHLGGFQTDFDDLISDSCQKLLFSATLTSDPAKIAELQLRNPKYFIVRGPDLEGDRDETTYMENFETPSTLREWITICETSMKPLILFYLALKRGVQNTLVFTKSAESTIRLLHLLNYFEEARTTSMDDGTQDGGLKAEAFSSDLTAAQRKNVLERFRNQKTNVLICSDLIARGMDIYNVAHVVNYDVPLDIRKYIHRVGRTARAGRDGDAWTLVEEQEMYHFKTMMSENNHFKKLTKLRVKEKELDPLKEYYQTALQRLREHYNKLS